MLGWVLNREFRWMKYNGSISWSVNEMEETEDTLTRGHGYGTVGIAFVLDDVAKVSLPRNDILQS